MQIIKNNPSLTSIAVEDKITLSYMTFIVPPNLELEARELLYYFKTDVFKILDKNKKAISIKKADKLKFYDDFNIRVEMYLKEKEWILITEKDIYYSRGDNLK